MTHEWLFLCSGCGSDWACCCLGPRPVPRDAARAPAMVLLVLDQTVMAEHDIFLSEAIGVHRGSRGPPV